MDFDAPVLFDPQGQDKNWSLILEARRSAESRTPRERWLMQKLGKKIYLGDEGPEKHKGWVGSSPFYLFWCPECEHWAKDYPHGYEHRQYLICSFCGTQYRFVLLRTKLGMLIERFKFGLRIQLYRLGVKADFVKPSKDNNPGTLTIFSACEQCGQHFEEQYSSGSPAPTRCRNCRKEN